ncbi:MAG: hypothetical protein ACYTGC_01920 [Planctomycetota bacterium]|jgi:hypothetical protein
MDGLSRTITRLFDASFAIGLSPGAALVVWSVLLGVAMATLFRWSTPQRRLRRVAERTRAELMALRLFNEDIVVAMRSHARVLGLVGQRLACTVPALLVAIVPLGVIVVQLALRFEHRPLLVGETTVVTLELEPDAWEMHQEAAPQLPPHVQLETPGLRDPVRHTIDWRVRVLDGEPATVRWSLGEEVIDKRLAISVADGAMQTVEPLRPGEDRWARLLHPAEGSLTGSDTARSVAVRYPRRQTPLFGIELPWWATLLIVSTLSALAVRPWLRVQF